MVKFYTDLQFFAKKKGGGSSKNGRDSKPKSLGIKVGDGQFVKAGRLLYLQRGTKIHPGRNVKRAGNDTLYAKVAGYVKFHFITRTRKAVSIITEKPAK